MQSRMKPCNILKGRNAILELLNPPVCKYTKTKQRIDCTMSVDRFIVDFIPSTIFTLPTCYCKIYYFKDIVFDKYVPIDLRKLSKVGCKNLQECITLNEIPRKKCVVCGKPRKIELLKYQIFCLERKNNKAITIKDIPLKLKIMEIEFKFYACIEFRKEEHFVSHILRKSGVWETYDDANRKVTKPPKTFIPNHFVYVQTV